MFGFPETPSSGFSTAVLEPHEKVIDMAILASRPADMSDLPADFLASLAPLDPGWASDNCESCSQEVHVGPRQLAEFQRSSGGHVILCMPCAAIMMSQPDVDTTQTVIRHLGGK
jgi:hypothetical protein